MADELIDDAHDALIDDASKPSFNSSNDVGVGFRAAGGSNCTMIGNTILSASYAWVLCDGGDYNTIIGNAVKTCGAGVVTTAHNEYVHNTV